MALQYRLMKIGFDRLFRAMSSERDSNKLEWGEVRDDLVSRTAHIVEPLGLKHQRDLEFVDEQSASNGLRRMFRIHFAGMGRPLTVNWGYCLDFVPHISAKKVRWHRTFKSAKWDFSILERNGPQVYYNLGSRTYERAVPGMLDAGIKNASQFWSEVCDLKELLRRVEQGTWQSFGKDGMAFGEHSRFLWKKSAFAEPFILASCNRGDDAVLQLNLVMDTMELSDTLRRTLSEHLCKSIAQMSN